MNIYLKLARQTIEYFLKTNKMLAVPDNLPQELLDQQKGVFVSFKTGNELRGCIGTFLPTHSNIAEEIIYNTIAAASQDPRFLPIEMKELDKIKIEVDLLSEPIKLKNKEIDQLNPKKFGIIVKSINGYKTGLLLPDLEGVDTVEKQVEIACQKAGIDQDSEPFTIYKFTVKRFEE